MVKNKLSNENQELVIKCFEEALVNRGCLKFPIHKAIDLAVYTYVDVDDKKEIEITPRYSTRIEDAWKLIERLRQKGKHCCIDISSDYNYTWTIKVTESARTNPHHLPTVLYDGEAQLPLAICISILRLHGHDYLDWLSPKSKRELWKEQEELRKNGTF